MIKDYENVNFRVERIKYLISTTRLVLCTTLHIKGNLISHHWSILLVRKNMKKLGFNTLQNILGKKFQQLKLNSWKLIIWTKK